MANLAASGGSPNHRAGSLDIPLRRTTGKDNLSKRASYIPPRSGASASDPLLVSGSGGTSPIGGAATYTSSPKQLPSPLSMDQGRTLTPYSIGGGPGSGSTLSGGGYVGEDGMLIPHDGSSTGSGSLGAANRTVRLVGTGASSTSVASEGSTGTGTNSLGLGDAGSSTSTATTNNNTLGSSSIYTHSYAGASSAVSMSSYSQTDLMSSRYPSSTKMSQAAAATSAAIADPEELEARAKVCAEKCWAEDETFVALDKMAEWLGGRYVLFLS